MAPGPDGICRHTLHYCAEQLGGVLHLFQLSGVCLHCCSYFILTVVEALYRSFLVTFVDDTALLTLNNEHVKSGALPDCSLE